jgi:hypothetical protein
MPPGMSRFDGKKARLSGPHGIDVLQNSVVVLDDP